MDEYKHEANFKRCLAQLSLDNVRCAIERADNIMKKTERMVIAFMSTRDISIIKKIHL